jgi:hypothetical protein
MDGTTRYEIDSAVTNGLTAVAGLCTISDMFPTDGNTMVFDQPRNYTVKMSCDHTVTTTSGIRMEFPTGDNQWTIMDTSRCEVGNVHKTNNLYTDLTAQYSCNGYNSTRKIEIFSFTTEEISNLAF